MPHRFSRPLVAVLALLFAVPALAADTVPTSVTDGAVVWTPDGEYTQALLTLTAASGLEYRRAFGPVEAVRLHPSEIGDEPLPDGLYSYELVVVPPGVEGEETVTALVQQGTLEVRDGVAVASPLLDQVINDDLIVTQSACIGFDCVNGESFGFDTLRLKENNLRLNFDDTSNTASFPSNDWAITANDTGNGGDSYLEFTDRTANRSPFRVEAGAPNWALFVEDSGDIGVGTNVPVVEVHVADGDSPTLRLEQNGTSGFTPQTWDLAGNEANFFVRDATNGSLLPFKIRPSSPTESIDIHPTEVRIGTTRSPLRVSNRVLIGFDTPSNAASNTIFEVGTEFDTDGDMMDDDLSRFRTDVRVDRSLSVIGDLTGEAFAFRVTNQANATPQLLNLTTTGNLTTAGTVNGTSDVNVKQDFVAVDPEAVLQGVVGLPISTWEYIATDGVTHMGPMAQDFHAAFGLGAGETTISMVDADGVSLAAIQALHARDEAAQARIAELEAENADLAARLARIEALLGASDE